MKDYPKMTGLKEGLVIGAGAGPWPFLNRNAEMMPNFFVKEDGSVLQVDKPARLTIRVLLFLFLICQIRN